MHNEYIVHAGVLKMKWGQRKYQNPDGTWTEEGKARRRAMYKSKKGDNIVAKLKPGPKKEVEKKEPVEEKPKTNEDLDRDIEYERKRQALIREQQANALEQARFQQQMTELAMKGKMAQLDYNIKLAQFKAQTAPKPAENVVKKYAAAIIGNAVTNIANEAGNRVKDKILDKYIPKKKEPTVYDIEQKTTVNPKGDKTTITTKKWKQKA